MPLDCDLPDLAATLALAAAIAHAARPGDAILLSGPLGAGKTEWARGFLRALSGDPALEVPSPTFTLVQTYAMPRGPVAHFDLWRLSDPSSLRELGFEDARGGIVLVEWPDRLGPRLPAADDPATLRLTLAIPDPETPDRRRATLDGWPDRLPALLDGIRQ
jgi:tRNA threonylcarbamoyladenosine biosynthesis protein TsaE